MNQLQNLDALAQLSQIQGDLVVWSNAALTNMEGLGPITQLFGRLWVDSNPMLTSLRGLEVGYLCSELTFTSQKSYTVEFL